MVVAIFSGTIWPPTHITVDEWRKWLTDSDFYGACMMDDLNFAFAWRRRPLIKELDLSKPCTVVWHGLRG